MNLFLPMLALGLLTSVHCIAMCGGLVLTYAVKGSEDETSRAKRFLPHLTYQGAKILSYTLVGLLLGSIGAVLNRGGVRGWIMVAAGAYMILLGLNMTGRFPVLRHLTPRPPKFLISALSKLRRKANADADAGHTTLLTPIAFGLMTGLMPCGPLQNAQIAAAGAGSPFYGALAMLGFGLGTAPLMLGFGLASSFITERFKKVVAVVSVVVILGVGVMMLNRGANLVGSPVTLQIMRQAVVESVVPKADPTTSEYTRGADGVVEVPLVIENVKFQPQNLSIPADEKVRIVVDRREANACSDQLAIPQLNVLVNLTPNGETIVELPATKAGTYNLTCGMGMMSGSLSVGGGAPSGGTSPLVPVLLVAALGAGGYAVYRSRKRAATVHVKGGAKRGATADGRTMILNTFTPAEAALLLFATAAAAIIGYLASGL